jgi:hypothetical protein
MRLVVTDHDVPSTRPWSSAGSEAGQERFRVEEADRICPAGVRLCLSLGDGTLLGRMRSGACGGEAE